MTRFAFGKGLSTLAALGALAAGTAPAASAVEGPAAKDIAAYMATTRLPCTGYPGGDTCTIDSMKGDVRVFYGSPEGSAPMAVAFVSYMDDVTGNAMDQMAIVLRREAGRWSVVGRADDTIGSDPRSVRFEPGAIAYVGTVMGPDDARVDPTCQGAFMLKVDGDGVTFAGPADGAARP